MPTRSPFCTSSFFLVIFCHMSRSYSGTLLTCSFWYGLKKTYTYRKCVLRGLWWHGIYHYDMTMASSCWNEEYICSNVYIWMWLCSHICQEKCLLYSPSVSFDIFFYLFVDVNLSAKLGVQMITSMLLISGDNLMLPEGSLPSSYEKLLLDLTVWCIDCRA